MSEVDCSKNWRKELLHAHRRIHSDLRAAKMPAYVPSKKDYLWEDWKVLPYLKHGQKVESLYNIKALEKALREHPCAQKEAEAQAAKHVQELGVNYGKGFYFGLAMAAAAVAISFRKKR